MKGFRFLLLLLVVGILATGCSHDTELTAPDNQANANLEKDGTEGLGVPSIAIAAGSGFVEGGVGMSVTVPTPVLDFTVPAGATINQVLVYWSGATTGAPGDDTIKVGGVEVTGTLIGGPTNFFTASSVDYWFSAYRADITDLGMVTDGFNDFEITEFHFDNTGGSLDENNGISMLVIYDDGTTADISLRDGLDLAFFGFDDPLDSTVPQTFTFAAESADRTAELLLFAGSVLVERPNMIKVTTLAGDEYFENLLESTDGLAWDSMILPVTVPAGDTSLTVELISTAVADPLGASLSWVGAGLSVPMSPPPELGCTLTIGYWKGRTGLGNGNQDDEVSQYLPITLGDEGGAKSLTVTDNVMALDVLKQRTYGRPNNGITKLYAQLLAAKLNFANGASDGDVAQYVADADAFLAEYDYEDWNDLTDDQVDDVNMWHGNLDLYNNGDIGPGHCEDNDDDDSDDKTFK